MGQQNVKNKKLIISNSNKNSLTPSLKSLMVHGLNLILKNKKTEFLMV